MDDSTSLINLPEKRYPNDHKSQMFGLHKPIKIKMRGLVVNTCIEGDLLNNNEAHPLIDNECSEPNPNATLNGSI